MENISFCILKQNGWNVLLTKTLTLLFIVCYLPFVGRGQDQTALTADRARALEMAGKGNFIGAYPLLEKIAQQLPDDAVVHENLAAALIAQASNEKDAERRIALLKRARGIAVQFKEKGKSTVLLDRLFDLIPADLKAQPPAAPPTPAEEALLAGEEAFAKGEMQVALTFYEKAEKLNPQLYEAPLFIGDVQVQLGEVDKAGQAYARAIAIDPDRETAYRYWGSTLTKAGKQDEARAKFIEALVCEPYLKITWGFFGSWAAANGLKLAHPVIDIPTSEKLAQKSDATRSNAVQAPDESAYWLVYNQNRALWRKEKFAAAYPAEKQYRHSLREEAESLRLTAEAAARDVQSGKLKQPTVSLRNLIQLHNAGLIEAYVLIAQANEAIAGEYADYRKEHREKLRRYFNEFVATPK